MQKDAPAIAVLDDVARLNRSLGNAARLGYRAEIDVIDQTTRGDTVRSVILNVEMSRIVLRTPTEPS